MTADIWAVTNFFYITSKCDEFKAVISVLLKKISVLLKETSYCSKNSALLKETSYC